jgi:hypothetical protein
MEASKAFRITGDFSPIGNCGKDAPWGKDMAGFQTWVTM